LESMKRNFKLCEINLLQKEPANIKEEII